MASSRYSWTRPFRNAGNTGSDHAAPQEIVLPPRTSWPSADFMLGSGMVIIQPSTGKVVLLHETSKNYWFLPKGRKDIGESLEDAALREAYEESGYRVQFLPVFISHNAPSPPGSPHRRHNLPCTEPFFMTSMQWARRSSSRNAYHNGDYFTFWYIGQIPADAIPEANTGMADEQNYKAHLLDINDALQLLREGRSTLIEHLVRRAYRLWTDTAAWMAANADCTPPDPDPPTSMLEGTSGANTS